MSNGIRRKFAAQGKDFHCSPSGQALIEWAMVVPLAFLLVINIVNYGALAYTCITVSNAARAGASYMTQGMGSMNPNGFPTQAQVTTLVQADMSSLPNHASATISVCSNKNGSNSAAAADPTTPYNCVTPAYSGTTAYADPEASVTSVSIGTVQVTYTFCPLISGWSFPALNISITLPSCTTGANNTITGGTSITRVAAMRLLN